MAAVVLVAIAVADVRGQEKSVAPPATANDPLFDRPEMIFAQQGPGGPGRRRGPGMRPPMDTGVQRKHIEQLRMLKLLEVLDLNEEQEPKFLMAFKGLRKQMRELDDRKQGVIEKLSEELKSTRPENRRINLLVDSVLAIESGKRESMQKFVETSRGILSPVQVGRLLVFTERFEYELLERVREFRGRIAPAGQAPGEPDDGQ
jgi:hypothetical protein